MVEWGVDGRYFFSISGRGGRGVGSGDEEGCDHTKRD